MSQEMDISWQVLRQIVRHWAGSSAELAEARPLDGGAISTTVALELADHQKAVCKITENRVDRSYVNEAHQLKLLDGLGIPVPKVFEAKVGSLEEPFSYILMEFIDGINLSEAKKTCTPEQFESLQENLAKILLTLHARPGESYGRVQIDPPAPTFKSWPEFYRAVFEPIFKVIMDNRALSPKCRKQIARIHERLDHLLEHNDVPRLLHWDIWGSNILVEEDDFGNWQVVALLDPDCKFAHVEAELAYMALFHTTTPAFMRAYQQTNRLSDDYHQIRKPIYQLYSLMNHLYLFGPEYLRPLMAAVEAIRF